MRRRERTSTSSTWPDYPSVFPLSDELVIRFALAGYNLGMGWNWARLHATQAMDRSAEPGVSETEAMTQFMRDALDLIVRLVDLRAQVQRTGTRESSAISLWTRRR